jgi:hypothetical protein
MTRFLRTIVGMIFLTLSCAVFAEPPKGWVPYSPSPEAGEALGAVFIGE